jgi:hypothetical protein
LLFSPSPVDGLVIDLVRSWYLTPRTMQARAG